MASSIIRKDAPNPSAAQAHAAVVPMWMDREELCRALGISRRALKRLIKRGAVEHRVSGKEARYRPLLSREAIRQLAEPTSGDDLTVSADLSEGSEVDGPGAATIEALAELDFSDLGLDEASFDGLDLSVESGAGFGPSTLDAALSIGDDRLRLVLQDDRVLFTDAVGQKRAVRQEGDAIGHAREDEEVDYDAVGLERDAVYLELDAVGQTQRALKRAALAIEQQEEAAARIGRLAHQRDKAIEANRALLHEHHRVAEERDGLIDRGAALIEQRDDAIRHLARAVHQREQTVNQLDHAINQRDKVINQLDRVIDQRDAILQKLNVAIEQRAMAVGHYEQARQLLIEWRSWQEDAQATLDESEARALKAQQLAQEALEIPWWNVSRRRQIREALKSL